MLCELCYTGCSLTYYWFFIQVALRITASYSFIHFKIINFWAWQMISYVIIFYEWHVMSYYIIISVRDITKKLAIKNICIYGILFERLFVITCSHLCVQAFSWSKNSWQHRLRSGTALLVMSSLDNGYLRSTSCNVLLPCLETSHSAGLDIAFRSLLIQFSINGPGSVIFATTVWFFSFLFENILKSYVNAIRVEKRWKHMYIS